VAKVSPLLRKAVANPSDPTPVPPLVLEIERDEL
jgi:hypothetical protein